MIARLSFAAAAALLATAATAHATVCVDDSASSGGTGACWTSPYRTIQEAVDHSADGETILIAAGTYPENVRLDRVGRRYLYGAGAGLTVITNTAASGTAGVQVVYNAGVDLYDLSFEGFTQYAVRNDFGSPMTVSGCTFTGAKAIFLSGGRQTITGNLFEAMSDIAIYIRPSSSNEVITIEDNDFIDVRIGVATGDWSAYPSYLTRVNVFDNRFEGATDYALQLHNQNQRASVYGNYIAGGDVGLSLVGGASVGVWNNIFDGNSSHAIQTTLGHASIIFNTMRDNGGAAVRCYTDTFYDTSAITNNAMLSNGNGLLLEAGCRATAKTNAAYDNSGGDYAGLAAPYDLGGNLTSSFSLNAAHRPASYLSPLIGAATPGGAHLGLDYYGVSRGTSPDIGACEYVPFSR